MKKTLYHNCNKASVTYNRARRFGLGSAIAMANHTIVDEGSLRDLKQAFERLMEWLKLSWPLDTLVESVWVKWL